MKTLAKTLSVLDLFTDSREEWRVTDIGRTLDLPVATTHRIVRALHDHGYLTRTPRARYRLHGAALDLGSRAVRTLDVREALHPLLRGLVDHTNETVVLSVPDERRGCALCVDRVEPEQSLRLSIDIGECTPLHAGATAKAMLAFIQTAAVEDVLRHPLEKLAPATIVEPAKLRAELEVIRRRGWAYSCEETDIGAWGVGAPVRTIGGNIVAVIGVVAPTARHSDAAIAKLARATKDAATRASRTLDPRLAGQSDGPPAGIHAAADSTSAEGYAESPSS